MATVELGLKFGGNEIIIFQKGVGIVAKEPAFLAVVENGKKMKVKAAGKRAEKLFLSKSSDTTVYQPIQNGEIVNEKMAVILIGEMLKDIIKNRFFLTCVKATVAVPCAMNQKQLYSLKRVLSMSGVNRVKFIQNAVAAREMLDIDSQSYVMVVDIGKYVTDISVLNEYNFQFGRNYFIGGANMDKSITTFIADNHNLEVSDLTSEEIKNEIASLYDRDLNTTEYIGIDSNNKFKRYNITANEVRVAIQNVYDKILGFIEDVIKILPKEIYQEIYQNGIMFVGGASSIAGLYEYAKSKLDLPIIVPEDCGNTVILGLGKLISGKKEYLKINF